LGDEKSTVTRFTDLPPGVLTAAVVTPDAANAGAADRMSARARKSVMRFAAKSFLIDFRSFQSDKFA
jgi:hypothetical protein